MTDFNIEVEHSETEQVIPYYFYEIKNYRIESIKYQTDGLILLDYPFIEFLSEQIYFFDLFSVDAEITINNFSGS